MGHCLVVGAGFLLIVGLLLRMTIRDAIPYLSVFFYASPLIVLALSALILSANRLLFRQLRTAAAWGLLAVVLFSWWHLSARFSQTADLSANDATASKRLLFWNISYVDFGWTAIIEELQKHDADIIGLVEVGPGYQYFLDEIRTAFPEHQLLWVGHGILLVRGEVDLLERGSLNNHGDYAVARSRFSDGQQLEVVLVDIYGFVLMPRGPAFAALEEILKAYEKSSVCLMGDFNTPPDSVFFRPVREHWENAFEAAGNGYHVTWPTVAPVLAIDHIWLPSGTAVASELTTTSLSDHRLVTATTQVAHSPQSSLRGSK